MNKKGRTHQENVLITSIKIIRTFIINTKKSAILFPPEVLLSLKTIIGNIVEYSILSITHINQNCK